MELITDYAKFFTATIYEWKPLLAQDKYKEIIIDSLNFLVKDHRIFVYGFVIMNNHIHLIWQMRDPYVLKNVQRDFLKFTAQKIRYDLKDNNPGLLSEFEVNLKDRKYQFWKRNPLSVDLYSLKVTEQNLDYIHQNPVNAGLVDHPTDYLYSSAGFYYFNKSEYTFLSHHEG